MREWRRLERQFGSDESRRRSTLFVFVSASLDTEYGNRTNEKLALTFAMHALELLRNLHQEWENYSPWLVLTPPSGMASA